MLSLTKQNSAAEDNSAHTSGNLKNIKPLREMGISAASGWPANQRINMIGNTTGDKEQFRTTG